MCKSNWHLAFVGDSITWGDGMLDGSFVAGVDRHIRTEWAATLLPHELDVSGMAETLTSRKFYNGSALKLTGAGSEASFVLEGDELSLVQAMERGKRPGSLIELYVDGVLHDTFSNFNGQPNGTERLRFRGDGDTDKFDLGRCHTYAHRVTVDGEKLFGSLNTGGYGAAFPNEHDFMIIRKYAQCGKTGEIAVHHYLWLKRPPRDGAAIEVTLRYGESIAYAKTTVGETADPFDSMLESKFGDGTVGVDTATPSAISTGLDFRETDERAVKTWKFPHAAKRRFALRVKGIDSDRGDVVAESVPYLMINFVTNRFHRLTNAGIGGWTARQFNADKGLRNMSRLMKAKPDIVFIGLGTNDDWNDGNPFAATRRVHVTERQLRRLPALYLKNCTYDGNDRYTVDTAELVIAEATTNRMAIDDTGADLSGVRQGDVVVIGNYYGDNRNVLCRIIHRWEADSRTATFTEPLHPTAVTKTVGDFAGQTVRIKRIDRYIEQMELMIETIRERNPAVRIALIDTGLSNFYTRLLMGYPEKLDELAMRKGVFRVHVYPRLVEWQYAQSPNIQAYIGNGQTMTSTGDSEYDLVSADGKDIHQAHGTQLRNWSVQVDGIERYGDGCHVEGGYAVAFRATLEREQLTLVDWDSHDRGRNPRLEYRFIPPKLVFTSHVPPQGATIDVKIASGKWSADDTHLNRQGGVDVYAKAIIETVDRLIEQRTWR